MTQEQKAIVVAAANAAENQDTDISILAKEIKLNNEDAFFMVSEDEIEDVIFRASLGL